MSKKGNMQFMFGDLETTESKLELEIIGALIILSTITKTKNPFVRRLGYESVSNHLRAAAEHSDELWGLNMGAEKQSKKYGQVWDRLWAHYDE